MGFDDTIYFFLGWCFQLIKSRQLPRLVMKDMEPLYTDELRKTVGELMLRLEAVPVTKGSGGFRKLKKQSRGQSLGNSSTGGSSSSLYRHNSEESPEINLKSKLDIHLNFNLEVSD